ncbi:MAG: YeeE/YedE family protein [Candidatus Aminicenantes bacterium]|nr:YeeE/YedE family protein [Candidatus Aminicenantes bacterium]
METKKYSNPYLAGVGLGLVMLIAFWITGLGLGASGAMMRTVVAVEKAVAPDHVNENFYLKKYGGEDKNPFEHWLIFEILGVFAGGIISGAFAGRIKKETNKGPKITIRKRWIFAFIGGGFFGFGARLARGCTSSVALCGGTTMAVGSWVTMIAIFAGAYMAAWFVRKLWI